MKEFSATAFVCNQSTTVVVSFLLALLLLLQGSYRLFHDNG